MEPFVTYLVRSTVSISILFFAYRLLFAKNAYFQLNRILLLSIVFIGYGGYQLGAIAFNQLFTSASIFPLENLPNENLTITLNELTIHADKMATQSYLFPVIAIIYLMGMMVAASRFLYNLYRILRLYFTGQKIKTKNYTIILLDKPIATFSFFHLLFINKDIYNDKSISISIIHHEEIHIHQQHSLDILLAEILKIIHWFNPVVYLLKHTISENHEYLADRGAIHYTSNISDYKILLLNQIRRQNISKLANNFSYSLIKKRIKMMEQKKSTFQSLTAVVVFSLIFSMVTISCTDKNNIQNEQPEKGTALETPATGTTAPEAEPAQARKESDTIYTMTENMPEFPGGRKALMQYLAQNIKYPEEAKRDSIQGRVFINFIIEKDGSVSNAKVIRGIGHGCDEAALEVVRNMPNWIPGEHDGQKVRVSFNIPIKYTLE